MKPSEILALVSVLIGVAIFGYFWYHDFPTVGAVLGVIVTGSVYGGYARISSDVSNMDREHHERKRWDKR